MRLWLRDPLAIAAEAADRGLVVSEGRIVEQVPAGGQPTEPVDQVFDAQAHVILPGLINTHHHFYQNLTRAYTPALEAPLFPWLQALYPVWAQLTPETFRIAVRTALTELLMSGCTTAADHHYVFPPGLEEAIDIEVEEAQRLGMRLVVSRGSMDRSVEDGGLPPAAVVQETETIVTDCERLIGRYHERGDGAQIQVALAPCSPFSVTRTLMRACADLGERHDVPLHTHLAENTEELAYCAEVFGGRPLDYLEAVGWLSDRVWLAHGIHFTDAECARLGAAGTAVCHCPSSNMMIGAGQCRVLDLEQAGVSVGLGVDGSAANDLSNLALDGRQALLLQRLQYGPHRVGHEDVLRWATEGSARCLRRSDIGSLSPGKQADLALFRLDELRFSGYENPLAALWRCAADRADRVMIAGQWRVIDGVPVGLDLAGLRRAHEAAAQQLRRGP